MATDKQFTQGKQRPCKRLDPDAKKGELWPFQIELNVSDENQPVDIVDRKFVEFVNKSVKWAAEHGTGESQKTLDIRDRRREFFESIDLMIKKFEQGGETLSLLIEASQARGEYNADRHVIQEKYKAIHVKVDGDDVPIDINFDRVDGITAEQERFFAEIRRTWIVVSVVLSKKTQKSIARRGGLKPKSWLSGERSAEHTGGQAADSSEVSRSDYLSKLIYIARTGISPEGVRFANTLLEGFKDEFVSREADNVKNRYVGLLGSRALLIGGAFAFAYLLLQTAFVLTPSGWGLVPLEGHYNWAQKLGAFMAMAAAACGGTWLSFSLRRVVLGFTDLASLENDRLNPTGRLFFVVGLTWVVGLFLLSGAIDVKLGGASLQSKILELNIALLLGVVCGISERALASAVSRRSDNMVTRFGG